MSPGNNNGKNYGGMHTGCGKKQKSGIYNTGIPQQRQPNNTFKPGIEVYNIKTGDIGIIIPKSKFKSKRSLSLVKYNSNKTQYIQNNLLRTLNYKHLMQKQYLKQNKKQRRNKRVKKNHNYREQRKQFRENKKTLNSILMEEFNVKYEKIKRHNKLVESNLHKLSNDILSLDTSDNNYKSKKSKLTSMYNNCKNNIKLLPSYLTQHGSSQNLIKDVCNYSDYIKYMNNYFNVNTKTLDEDKSKDEYEIVETYKNNKSEDNLNENFEIVQSDKEQIKNYLNKTGEEDYKIRRIMWGLNP